jgi:hypothetical protein
VLLRFFEKKNLKEVGHVLGSKEDAVQSVSPAHWKSCERFFFDVGLRCLRLRCGCIIGELSSRRPASLTTSTFAAATANSGTASTFALLKSSVEALFYTKLKPRRSRQLLSCWLAEVG